MAEAPKNKSSLLFSLISSGLLHLTLMLLLFALLRNEKTGSIATVEQQSIDLLLVEFDALAQNGAIDEVKKAFLDKYGNQTAELDFISKDKAYNELTLALSRNKPVINNPLKDMLILKFEEISPYLLAEIKTFLWGSPGVAGVYHDGVKASANSEVTLGKSSPILSSTVRVLAIIIILLLPYLWFRSWMKSYISSNKLKFRSLILYGAENHYFSKLMSKTLRKTTINGWLIAIALYFLMIYLFFGGSIFKINQISTTNQFVVLSAPLIISFIMSAVLARNSYFRELEN